MMFTALEEWHFIPWLDPITKEEYPEIRYSMFRMLDLKNKRIRKDQKKADMEAKMRR